METRQHYQVDDSTPFQQDLGRKTFKKNKGKVNVRAANSVYHKALYGISYKMRIDRFILNIY